MKIEDTIKDYKEVIRKKQIEYLRTYYNRDIVDAAIEYADSMIDRQIVSLHDSTMLNTAKAKALEAGQEEVAEFIEMQNQIDYQEAFNALTFAYVQGVVFGLDNHNISKTPKPVNNYALSKDFAFIFDFADNDYRTYIERAAQEYCKEYNRLLNIIEMEYDIAKLYKKDIEFMENPDNVREIMKAAFIGEYMTGSVDRCWLGEKTDNFNAAERLINVQDLANNYFNFKSNTDRYSDNTERVDWKFGTWDEVSKFGLEEFKGQQSDTDIKRANGDFTKYWLNGEVLIVRMVDGRLVAEVH